MLILVLTAGVLLLGERAAFAYVDPGTGSLLYQTALALVLGLGLVFRRVRVSIVDRIKRLARKGSGPGGEATQGSGAASQP